MVAMRFFRQLVGPRAEGFLSVSDCPSSGPSPFESKEENKTSNDSFASSTAFTIENISSNPSSDVLNYIFNVSASPVAPCSPCNSDYPSTSNESSFRRSPGTTDICFMPSHFQKERMTTLEEEVRGASKTCPLLTDIIGHSGTVSKAKKDQDTFLKASNACKKSTYKPPSPLSANNAKEIEPQDEDLSDLEENRNAISELQRELAQAEKESASAYYSRCGSYEHPPKLPASKKSHRNKSKSRSGSSRRKRAKETVALSYQSKANLDDRRFLSDSWHTHPNSKNTASKASKDSTPSGQPDRCRSVSNLRRLLEENMTVDSDPMAWDTNSKDPPIPSDHPSEPKKAQSGRLFRTSKDSRSRRKEHRFSRRNANSSSRSISSMDTFSSVTSSRSASASRRSLRSLSSRDSSNSLGSFLLPVRNTKSRSFSNSSSRFHRHSTELNIFGSDIVSTDFILAQLREAKENADIVKVEFEDLLEHCTIEIVSAIQELLICDDRPWESVHFVDEIIVDSKSICRSKLQRKCSFTRNLKTICKLKLIPLTFCTKLTLSSTHINQGEESLTPANMARLLRRAQIYKNVTVLHVITHDVTLAIVKELTSLFCCDNRNWKSVHHELSGSGPYEQNTRDHKIWCDLMEMAYDHMQLVAMKRGIELIY